MTTCMPWICRFWKNRKIPETSPERFSKNPDQRSFGKSSTNPESPASHLDQRSYGRDTEQNSEVPHRTSKIDWRSNWEKSSSCWSTSESRKRSRELFSSSTFNQQESDKSNVGLFDSDPRHSLSEYSQTTDFAFGSSTYTEYSQSTDFAISSTISNSTFLNISYKEECCYSKFGLRYDWVFSGKGGTKREIDRQPGCIAGSLLKKRRSSSVLGIDELPESLAGSPVMNRLSFASCSSPIK